MKNLNRRAGFNNRHITPLPTEKCKLEIITKDITGESTDLVEWNPFKKEEWEGSQMPHEGYLGCARTIAGQFIGIGFNAWEQNDSEFIYWKLVGEETKKIKANKKSKSNLFSYALFQYHPFIVSGEFLNIGMLFYFNDTKLLYFLHPGKRLIQKRIKGAFGKVPLKTIVNSHIDFIGKRVKEFNADPIFLNKYDMIRQLNEYINDNIIRDNPNALQFSKQNTGLITHDNEKISNEMFDLYFKMYKDI